MSDLVGNSKDQFSDMAAHLINTQEFIHILLLSLLQQVLDEDSSSLSAELDSRSRESQDDRRLGQVSTMEVPYSRVSRRINPLLTNGLAQRYHLGESTSIFRVIKSDFKFLFHFLMKFL